MRRYIALLADTQLDKRLYGLEDTRQDWFKALTQAFNHLYSIRDELCAIAVLGDIFDTESVGSEAAYAFQSALARFRDTNIPILLILGNHDANPNKEVNWTHVCRLVNDSVVPLAFSEPFRIPAEDNLPEIVILGNDHLSRKEMEEAMQQVTQPETEGEVWFFLHQALAELAPHKDAWDVQALQIPDWANRVFLGDFHNHAAYTDPRDIEFAYPGAIETVSFNQTERPGFLLFDRQKNDYEHILTEQREYISLSLTTHPSHEWEPWLVSRLEESEAAHEGRKPVLRVFYPAFEWEVWQEVRAKIVPHCLRLFDLAEGAEEDSDIDVEIEKLPDTREEVKELACRILDADDNPINEAVRRVLLNPNTVIDLQQEKFPQATLHDTTQT